MKPSRKLLRVLLAGTCALATAASAATSAGATDLDALRERAQTVASDVSELERRFAELSVERDGLAAELERADQEIALLELDISEAENAYQAALDRYVERAVVAYKAGPLSRSALLLSATDLNDLFLLSHATSRAAELDVAAVEEMIAARDVAQRLQRRIDQRKQRLLGAKAEADLLAIEIDATLETRRDVLDQLETEIGHLEAEARRQAALAANPSMALRSLLQPTGPGAIPKGFVGTGVAIEGTASWYGPGFEGNPTATGDIFDSSLFTAASKELPLNTWLYVEHEGRGVVVLVNDRGPYVKDWILDLSHAAAQAIGITGIGWVRAEILLKV